MRLFVGGLAGGHGFDGTLEVAVGVAYLALLTRQDLLVPHVPKNLHQ